MYRVCNQICAVIAVAGALVAPSTSVAQPTNEPHALSYACKFSCGRTVDSDVVRGFYLTSCNVHNPNLNAFVRFSKKAVIALPESNPQRGPISKKRQEFLKPDEAFRVDCEDVRSLFPGVPLPAHIEGFVVIEVLPQPTEPVGRVVTPELDVVGKYSARAISSTASAPEVRTLDIEDVTPKVLPCFPDATGAPVCQ